MTRSRSASTLRLAGTVVGFLLLSANQCYKSSSYGPTSPEVRLALTLRTADGSTSLPADGISRLTLVAQISADASPTRRTVVFATSAGTLVGGTDDGGGSRKVEADGTGSATIELVSSQQVEAAQVSASVDGVPGLLQRLTIAFVAADPNTTVRFVAAPASAPADGATVSTFTVEVSAALPSGTQVSFAATLGAFAPEGSSPVNRPVDGSRRASADLVSPTTLGTARVLATANNVTREVSLRFDRAYPQRVTVSTQGKFQVKADNLDTATVTATFLRDIGLTTEGTVATFRATDANGQTLGFFRDVGTVAAVGNGRQATATFLAGSTAYRGTATITVGVEGSSVTGTTEIEIVDP